MVMDVDMGMEIEMEMEIDMSGEDGVCRYRYNCIQRWDKEFHWVPGSCSRVREREALRWNGTERKRKRYRLKERSRERQSKRKNIRVKVM